MSNDEINKGKYLEVLQLLLDRETGANNEHLGKVKLMKLLYYIDFDHYMKHGQSITGDTYIKLEYGPVPRHGPEMLDEMCEIEWLQMKVEPVISYAKYNFHLIKRLEDPQYLSEEEIATITAVIEKWKSHSRQEIVTAVHGEPPWKMVEYGEEIPYQLVHYRRNVILSEDDEEPEPMPITSRDRRAPRSLS